MKIEKKISQLTQLNKCAFSQLLQGNYFKKDGRICIKILANSYLALDGKEWHFYLMDDLQSEVQALNSNIEVWGNVDLEQLETMQKETKVVENDWQYYDLLPFGVTFVDNNGNIGIKIGASICLRYDDDLNKFMLYGCPPAYDTKRVKLRAPNMWISRLKFDFDMLNIGDAFVNEDRHLCIKIGQDWYIKIGKDSALDMNDGTCYINRPVSFVPKLEVIVDESIRE